MVYTSRTMKDERPTLERVRWEVMSLLARTPKLELETLYQRIRDALGEDTEILVAKAVSLLLRAGVIALEPIQFADPDSGMFVELCDPSSAAV